MASLSAMFSLFAGLELSLWNRNEMFELATGKIEGLTADQARIAVVFAFRPGQAVFITVFRRLG